MKIPRPKLEQNPDARYIRSMFDGMARRYDIFTFLIGLGQDRRLRRRALDSVGQGQRVLDIGCGTGGLSFEALNKVGPTGEVVGLDFSPDMIEEARRRQVRLSESNSNRLRFVVKSAEEIPFETEPYDIVVSAYVLRNLFDNITSILSGVNACLKAGGRVAFLDLTEPRPRVLRFLYRFYLFAFVGIYGLVLFGRKYPVPYLPDSSKRFLNKEGFLRELERAGFSEAGARSFMLGAITLYTARKGSKLGLS